LLLQLGVEKLRVRLVLFGLCRVEAQRRRSLRRRCLLHGREERLQSAHRGTRAACAVGRRLPAAITIIADAVSWKPKRRHAQMQRCPRSLNGRVVCLHGLALEVKLLRRGAAPEAQVAAAACMNRRRLTVAAAAGPTLQAERGCRCGGLGGNRLGGGLRLRRLLTLLPA